MSELQIQKEAEYKSYGPFAVSDAFDDSVWCRKRTARLFGLTMRWPFPLVSGVHGSSAIILGTPVFGKAVPRYVKWLYSIATAVSDARYWVLYRVHPEYQYHLVRTGLRPGYHDEDEIILHACMAMLCKYVEWHGKEEEFAKFSDDLRSNLDPNAPEGVQEQQAGRQDEALAIYRWWKYQKPADEKRRTALLHELYGERRRWTTKPTDHPLLEQLVFEEFKGDEICKEDEFRALEDKIASDEQAMLHRLIDIRRSLWT